MPDDTTLSVGTGGDKMRNLLDAAGRKWPPAVACFATTIADSANILQVVTPTAGLPVSSSQETGTIYNGGAALVPKFAIISASVSGNTAIVAAVTGKKIRVLRWSVSANGTVAVKFRRGSTDITGSFYLTQFAMAGGGYCLPGHFETDVGEGLNVNLSASVAVGGVLTYIEV